MPNLSLKLHGLIAAPFTPFHDSGDLALDRIEQQAQFLSTRGVAGVFIAGTTGEGISLTVDERLALARAWKLGAGGMLKLIVHVGHSSLRDSITLAEQAGNLGVDGIAFMPASCIVPDNLPTLVAECAEVAAAAPDLPFYYYHIPSLSRAHFKIRDLLEMAADRIPNLAGCKFTYEDLMDYTLAAGVKGGRYDMLFGRDEMLLASLALGAEGWVGSTFNFAAPLYLKIIAAYRSGDIAAARRFQAEACEMIRILIQFGGLPAMKALCKILGLDLGPVRLPMQQPEASSVRQMARELERFMPDFAPLRKKTDATVVRNGQAPVAAAV